MIYILKNNDIVDINFTEIVFLTTHKNTLRFDKRRTSLSLGWGDYAPLSECLELKDKKEMEKFIKDYKKYKGEMQ